MKTFPIVTLISLTCFLCGCESPLYMASRLPGLSQLNDSLNERAFREWMKSDPAPQVKARVARGNYALLGLALHNQENDWIPGISERERSKHRYDVEWLGMDGSYEQHVPIAERYVAEFNSLMLEARRGVTLDTYGHSSANQYHIPPRA